MRTKTIAVPRTTMCFWKLLERGQASKVKYTSSIPSSKSYTTSSRAPWTRSTKTARRRPQIQGWVVWNSHAKLISALCGRRRTDRKRYISWIFYYFFPRISFFIIITAIQADYFVVNRYRSMHTLSSSAKSQQSSPPDSKNSERQTSSCQSSRTNSPNAVSAQEDAPTRESCAEKSALTLESRKDSTHPEDDQSSEMSRVSDPQANSKITSEGETSATSMQTSEASGVNNWTSPRRKISVYCRSFDLTTMQDPCENQESTLKTRQLSCDQLDENSKNQNSSFKYSFNHNYRNVKNDSDSSSNSTPQKQSQDSQLEDEPPIDRSIRKVYLAPTRLKLPPKVTNELDETAEISNCTSFAADFSVLTISSSPLSSIVDNGREKDDIATGSSSTCVTDECETEVMCKSKSCLTNGNFSQKHPTSARRLILHNHPGKSYDLILINLDERQLISFS